MFADELLVIFGGEANDRSCRRVDVPPAISSIYLQFHLRSGIRPDSYIARGVRYEQLEDLCLMHGRICVHLDGARLRLVGPTLALRLRARTCASTCTCRRVSTYRRARTSVSLRRRFTSRCR